MTIKEIYEKIKNSPDLKKKAIEAAKNSKVEEFLKENDFDVTVDQIKDFIASAKKGELSKEELNMAAGGCDGGCLLDTGWSMATLGIGCAISVLTDGGKTDITCVE